MKLRLLVAHNFFMQLLGKGITAGSTFLITIFLADRYKASGYGEFTAMMAYVSVFYLLVDFGMNAAFLKKAQSDQTRVRSLFTSLFILRILLSLVLMFIGLAILPFLPEGFSFPIKLGIIVLIPTILIQAVVTTFNALFQKELHYDKAALSVLLGSAATLVLVYGFGSGGAPIPLVVSSFLAGGIVMVAASYALSRHVVRALPASLPVQKKDITALFVAAVPLGISLVFNTIHFRADIFVLTATRPASDVGIYGLASKFFEFPLTIPTFFMNAVYPLMLRIRQKKDSLRWRKLMTESLLFLTAASVFVAVAGFIAAPLLPMIAEDFSRSLVPFRILVATLPLFFISSLLGWVLIASGKTWSLVWMYGAAMLVNVVLNIVFTPRFGPIAPAVITGVSEGFVLVLLAANVIKSRLLSHL